MNNQRETLVELGFEDTLVFDNPSFDNAILGTTEDGRVVYSYDLMVSQLSLDERLTREEAEEFIEYNTIRTIPYMGEKAPVIVFNTLEF